MVLNKLIYKDRAKRNTFLRTELNNKLMNYLLFNEICDGSLKKKILIKKHTQNKKSCIATINNKCIYTGRERGVFRKFKVSRIYFKKLIETGTLYGLQKSSW